MYNMYRTASLHKLHSDKLEHSMKSANKSFTQPLKTEWKCPKWTWSCVIQILTLVLDHKLFIQKIFKLQVFMNIYLILAHYAHDKVENLLSNNIETMPN